jgi:hypothetical protein
MQRTSEDHQRHTSDHASASKPTSKCPEAAVKTLRCECGRLLARVLKAAVELKCSRCKRVVILVEGRRYQQPGVTGCDCLESLCG